jgi:DNA-nicking Smr family endonuclease
MRGISGLKKRSKDQAPKSFEHSPFKALKGFTPSPQTAKPKPVSSRGREKPAEDDSDLFQRAVEGVNKLQEEDVPASAVVQPKSATPARPAPAQRDERLFLDAMKNIGTVAKGKTDDEDDVDGGNRRSATSRMRQLKRGTIRIAEELDLHGYLRDEAIARLGTFVTAAFGRGQQAVLVITGKGINSPEGPVLQGAVAEWLRSAGKGMVAEFSPAPRDMGGSGAYVVFLKKR